MFDFLKIALPNQREMADFDALPSSVHFFKIRALEGFFIPSWMVAIFSYDPTNFFWKERLD